MRSMEGHAGLPPSVLPWSIVVFLLSGCLAFQVVDQELHKAYTRTRGLNFLEWAYLRLFGVYHHKFQNNPHC